MKLIGYVLLIVLFSTSVFAAFTYQLDLSGKISVQDDDVKGLSTKISVEQDESQEILDITGDFGDDFVADWGDVNQGQIIDFNMNITLSKEILYDREGSYSSSQLALGGRIDSDFKIEGQSAQMIGDTSLETVYNAARYIRVNINETDFSGRSTEVFTRKEGDLASRNALFSSFLRERGIPTMSVYGLAEDDVMNPHIWTEVYLGKWIPVDLDMFEIGSVDHTHIALRRSDTIDTEIAESKAYDIGNAKIVTNDLDFSVDTLGKDRIIKTIKTDTRALAGQPYSIIEVIFENTGETTYYGLVELPKDEFIQVIPEREFLSIDPGDKAIVTFQVEVMSENLSLYQEAYLREPIFVNNLIQRNMSKEEADNLKGLHILDSEPDQVDIRSALNSSFSDTKIDDIIEKNEQTMENIVMEKYTLHDDKTNKTKVVVRITPKEGLKNVSIYESIPKCLAEQIKEIDADHSFVIIEDDPLILWQFDDLDSPIEISYEVLNAIRNTDCEDKALTIAIAEQLSGEKVSHTLAIYSIIISTVILLFISHVVIRP